MKSKLFMLIVILGSLSCSGDSEKETIIVHDFSTTEFPQRWDLFKMSIGMLANSELTGNDMKYKEYYIFNEDHTFSKNRIENGIEIIAEGSYTVTIQNRQTAYSLEFNEQNNLIGNCGGDLTEYLYLDADNETLLSNWWACDGPGLFYKQVEIK